MWRWLDQLGDEQSFRLLEKFMPSDVFHVDSIVWKGEIMFTVASAYGKPPLSVSHGGGVFTTRVLPRESDESRALRELNGRVVHALAPSDYTGAIHAEYLRTLEGQTLVVPGGRRRASAAQTSAT